MDSLTAPPTPGANTGLLISTARPPAWCNGLMQHGFAVQQTSCTHAARQWAAARTVQALIVCVDTSPCRQTIDLCHWVLAHTDLAVLVWSATEPPSDSAGADDWITGPIEPIEMAARLQAALRRSRRAPPSPVTSTTLPDTRPWLVDVQQRQLLTPQGLGIALSPREWQLLMVLLTHRGHVLSPKQLGELMRDAEQGVHAIRLLVSRLRQKLQRACAQTRTIETVRGWGYRLPPITQSVTPDKLRKDSTKL